MRERAQGSSSVRVDGMRHSREGGGVLAFPELRLLSENSGRKLQKCCTRFLASFEAFAPDPQKAGRTQGVLGIPSPAEQSALSSSVLTGTPSRLLVRLRGLHAAPSPSCPLGLARGGWSEPCGHLCTQRGSRWGFEAVSATADSALFQAGPSLGCSHPSRLLAPSLPLLAPGTGEKTDFRGRKTQSEPQLCCLDIKGIT